MAASLGVEPSVDPVHQLGPDQPPPPRQRRPAGKTEHTSQVKALALYGGTDQTVPRCSVTSDAVPDRFEGGVLETLRQAAELSRTADIARAERLAVAAVWLRRGC